MVNGLLLSPAASRRKARDVVDVDPNELTLAAVNRYLDIKSRGVL